MCARLRGRADEDGACGVKLSFREGAAKLPLDFICFSNIGQFPFQFSIFEVLVLI